jgi:hypothetical protein
LVIALGNIDTPYFVGVIPGGIYGNVGAASPLAMHGCEFELVQTRQPSCPVAKAHCEPVWHRSVIISNELPNAFKSPFAHYHDCTNLPVDIAANPQKWMTLYPSRPMTASREPMKAQGSHAHLKWKASRKPVSSALTLSCLPGCSLKNSRPLCLRHAYVTVWRGAVSPEKSKSLSSGDHG